MERDICDVILSVNVRINQPFVDQDGVGHVFVAKQQRSSKAAPVATPPPTDNAGLLDAEEVDRVCLENAEVCEEAQKKSVLPEMPRLEECIEK